MRNSVINSKGISLIGRRRANIMKNLNNKNYNPNIPKSNNPLQNLFVGRSAKRMNILTPENKAFRVYHKSKANQSTKKFTKYSRGIGAGLGTLAGGGLGYLAANKMIGKKGDFIEKTLRKYPGITKAAAEQIYKDTKRKYLLRGTIGGAVVGGGAGLLIGSKFRKKPNTQQPQPQNYTPVQQTQPSEKESPLRELKNKLSNSKRQVHEASNDLDSHKVNTGRSIVERHNDAANKINEAMDRIKKNSERINKTSKTQADVDRMIKENSRAIGIGNNDVTLDTSNVKETKNTKTLDDLIKRMGGNPNKANNDGRSNSEKLDDMMRSMGVDPSKVGSDGKTSAQKLDELNKLLENM